MTKEVMKQALDAFEAIMMARDIDSATTIAKNARYGLREALKQEQNEPKCKTHPDAPHGFVRNASHSEDRYVCECEFWDPPDQDEPVAYINVEQRKLEWSKYTSWETPTVVNLPKIPLYIKPQTKEWVELTDNQLVDLVIKNAGFPTKLAKAIEAKLKEKNT